MTVSAALLLLTACAALPAVLALLFIRGKLAERGAKFWSPFGLGLFALSLVAIGAIAWASAASEADITACATETAATQVDCEDAGLLVVVAGVTAILSLAIYLVGGVGAHAILRRRAKRDDAAT